MLKKSKKSAFIMGCITILAALIGITILGALSRPEKGIVDSVLGIKLDASVSPLDWLVLIVALILMILIASWSVSWFVYKCDESHFGFQGAVRWIALGLVYGLLLEGLSQLGCQSYRGFKALLQAVAIVAPYLIVFKVFPPKVSLQRSNRDETTESQ